MRRMVKEGLSPALGGIPAGAEVANERVSNEAGPTRVSVAGAGIAACGE